MPRARAPRPDESERQAAAEAIRAALAATGLSQVRLAHAIGVHPPTLRRWLSGARRCQPAIVAYLRAVADCPTLLSGTHPRDNWRDRYRTYRRIGSAAPVVDDRPGDALECPTCEGELYRHVRVGVGSPPEDAECPTCEGRGWVVPDPDAEV
jgi:lambda repressor-like predicted transcriptional regulator